MSNDKNLNDITIKKINYLNLPKSFKINQSNNKKNGYYCIFNNEHILGYFITYNNVFHSNNKYLYPVEETFDILNKKEVFTKISEHFKKPLQIMVDSRQKKITETLYKVGFNLKRKSFEREFKNTDLKNNKHNKVNLKVLSKESNYYNKAAMIAFDHYVKTHKNINAFSKKFKHFKKILPETVITEIVNYKIINLVFVEENELCYFGSQNEKTFNWFAKSLISSMFFEHQTIKLEIDSTDQLALRFKGYFNDKNNDSFDTFIFNEVQ